MEKYFGDPREPPDPKSDLGVAGCLESFRPSTMQYSHAGIGLKPGKALALSPAKRFRSTRGLPFTDASRSAEIYFFFIGSSRRSQDRGARFSAKRRRF